MLPVDVGDLSLTPGNDPFPHCVHAVIQEIVNLNGWKTDSSISIISGSTGDTRREAYAVTGGASSKFPRLEVEYYRKHANPPVHLDFTRRP